MRGPLAVLGDSWTDPRDPENIGCGWPQQVAARLGLGLTVAGMSGAGYVNSGDALSTFPVQAVRGAAVGASAVIVWGSVNDVAHPPAAVYAAAVETYRLIRLAAPDAPLLVYGPQMWSTVPDPRLYAVGDAVRRAAVRAGALFADPLAWFAGHPELEDGSVHPSCLGHDLIASRVAVDLLFALTAAMPVEGRPEISDGAGYPLPFELPAVSGIGQPEPITSPP